MKKIICTLITLLMLFTLAACNEPNDSQKELEDYQKVFFINVVNNTDHDIQGIRYKIDLKEEKGDNSEAYKGEEYAYKVGETINVAQCGQPDRPIESFEGFEIEMSVMETDGTVSDVVDRIPIEVEYYREYFFSLTNKDGNYNLELIETKEPTWIEELENK